MKSYTLKQKLTLFQKNYTLTKNDTFRVTVTLLDENSHFQTKIDDFRRQLP